MEDGELVCSLMVCLVPLDNATCLAMRRVSWRFFKLVQSHQIPNFANGKHMCEHLTSPHDNFIIQKLVSNGCKLGISNRLYKKCSFCYAQNWGKYIVVVREIDYARDIANPKNIPHVEYIVNGYVLSLIFLQKHVRGLFDLETKYEKESPPKRI